MLTAVASPQCPRVLKIPALVAAITTEPSNNHRHATPEIAPSPARKKGIKPNDNTPIAIIITGK